MGGGGGCWVLGGGEWNDTEGGPSTHFDAFLNAPRAGQTSKRLD